MAARLDAASGPLVGRGPIVSHRIQAFQEGRGTASGPCDEVEGPVEHHPDPDDLALDHLVEVTREGLQDRFPDGRGELGVEIGRRERRLRLGGVPAAGAAAVYEPRDLRL
jgi:hypothetical protein